MRTFTVKPLLFACLVFTFSSSFAGAGEAQKFYDLGMNSLEKSEYTEAISNFTKAISIDPNYAEAYYQRAISKDKLGEHVGFVSTELCFDLIQAKDLGHPEAELMLRKRCESECYNLESSFLDPEMVFCADFSSHVLTELPAETSSLQFLISLNLFNNRFTEIPAHLEEYRFLLNLNMNSNRLSAISEEILHAENLIDLSLNKNSIKEIPAHIGKLTHLVTLQITNNLLEKVSPEIGKLSKLEVLDLSFNKLTSLPAEIALLKNIKQLNLIGNQFPEQEQKRIKALFPKAEVYF